MQDQPKSEHPHARRAAYERRTQSLVGLRLAAVRYFVLGQIDEPIEPEFDWDAEFDHLDRGLELEGHDGRIVGLTWDSEFDEFNLGIMEGGLGLEGYEPHADVSDSSRWHPLVTREITAVDVRWIEDEETSITLPAENTGLGLLGLGLLTSGAPTGTGERPGLIRRLKARLGRRLLDGLAQSAEEQGAVEVRQRLFPVAVRLTFGTDRIWIGAVEVGPDSSWVGADSVTVVPDGDAARRLEVWE